MATMLISSKKQFGQPGHPHVSCRFLMSPPLVRLLYQLPPETTNHFHKPRRRLDRIVGGYTCLSGSRGSLCLGGTQVLSQGEHLNMQCWASAARTTFRNLQATTKASESLQNLAGSGWLHPSLTAACRRQEELAIERQPAAGFAAWGYVPTCRWRHRLPALVAQHL
jgi:hypothetical protein